MSIWLVGGLQLMAIGLVGEYIGKAYQEVKQRPRYIVDVDLLNGPMIARHEREKLAEEIS